MNELALFAGAGGGILAGQLLGWRTVCAVEIEPYPASVLLARQNDGLLPPFPVWDDVRTFDGRPWRGIVDVVSGGFPCQDISVAGKGAGIEGERSGLWSEFARIIREVRPRFAFVENSPALTSRGLGRVLGDLAEMGFDAQWGVLGAADVGAPHHRKRIWIVAHSNGHNSKAGRREQRRRDEQGPSSVTSSGINLANPKGICSGNVADASSQRLQEPKQEAVLRARRGEERRAVTKQGWWAVEPNVGRVAHGVAARVDRLKAIGNGQVPQCAAEAWRLLSI